MSSPARSKAKASKARPFQLVQRIGWLGFTSSAFERLGGGIAQEFDNASMTLYLKYQHYQVEADGVGLDPSLLKIEDAHFISIGDVITF